VGVKELEAASKRNCDLVGPAGKGGSYDLSAVALTKARRCDCLLPMEFLARLLESPRPSPIWNADDCHRDWPLEQFEKIAACSIMSAVRYLSEMLKQPQGLVEFGDGLGQVPKCLDFGVTILAQRIPLKASDPVSGLAATWTSGCSGWDSP
jgi:hypothetical protein